MAGERKGQRCREDVLNPQELENLVSGCSSLRDKFIIYCLAFGGLRVSEMVHLRRTWINLDEKTLTVPLKQDCRCKDCNRVVKKTGKSKGGVWRPKTEHGHRTIRIHPVLSPIIEEFLASSDGLGLTRQRVWQRIKELKDNLPSGHRILHNIYPHCLRATCATDLAHEKISSPALQHTFGWSRLSSAEFYVRTGEQRAIKELDEIYSKYDKNESRT